MQHVFQRDECFQHGVLIDFGRLQHDFLIDSAKHGYHDQLNSDANNCLIVLEFDARALHKYGTLQENAYGNICCSPF